jgi:anaerobic carbon-monoxide dehydrogenase iron sulfur subunit
MEKYLLAFPELCTGCLRCAYACSATHEGVFRPSMSRIHIQNFPEHGAGVPNICFQCPNAECMKACPEQAIYRNDLDVVLIDKEKCTGCLDCVTACPYGMIDINEDKVAYKCDLCDGDPACVKECYSKAIVFEPADKDSLKIRALQMKEQIPTGDAEEKRYQRAIKHLSDIGRRQAV